MPTLEELKRQLESEGASNIERKRRISEAWRAGELTPESEPLMSTEEAVRLHETKPTQERLAGTIQRMREEGAAEEEIRRIFHAPGVRRAAASYLGAEPVEPKVPEYPQEYLEAQAAEGGAMPMPSGGGAFTPTQTAQMQPAVQWPTMGAPGTKGLEEALAEQAKTFKAGEKRLKGATEGYQKAVGEWAEAERAGFEEEAKVRQEQREALELEQAQMVFKEQQRQEAIDADMTKVRDAIDQMKASKIDPYRFYKHPDGSTNYPKSIASAIAVGLGALGASLPSQYGGTGGQNAALQIIDKAIDRDIQAQRDDIANKRTGVGIQMNLLSQMRAQFSDERQAEAAARVVMLETYKMKLEETAARSQNKKLEANAQMLIAQADQREVEILNGIQDRAAAAAVAGEEKLFGARARQAQARYQNEVARLKQTMQQTGGPPPGLTVIGPTTKKFTEQAVEKLGMYNNVKELVREAKALRKDYGAKVTPGKIKTEMESLGATLMMAAKDLYAMGANWTEMEKKILEQAIGGDLTALGWVYEKLDAFDRRLDVYARGYLKPRGYDLAQAPIEGARRR